MNASVKSQQPARNSTGEFSVCTIIIIIVIAAFVVPFVGCASMSRLTPPGGRAADSNPSLGPVSAQSDTGIDNVDGQPVDGITTWRPGQSRDVGEVESTGRGVERLEVEDPNESSSSQRNSSVDGTILEDNSTPITIRTIQIERIKREILRYLGLIEAPKDSWDESSMDSVGRSVNLVLPKPLRGHHAAAFVDDLELARNHAWRSDSTPRHTQLRRHHHYEEMSDAELSEMSDDPSSYNENDDQFYPREYDSSDEDSNEDDFLDDDQDNYLPPKSRTLVIFGDELYPWRGMRPGTNCYQFKLNGIDTGASVTSAQLWVYKLRDTTHFSSADQNQTITILTPPPSMYFDSVSVPVTMNENRTTPSSTTISSSRSRPTTTSETTTIGERNLTTGIVRLISALSSMTSPKRPVTDLLNTLGSVETSSKVSGWTRIDVTDATSARLLALTHHQRPIGHQQRRRRASTMSSRSLQLTVDCRPRCSVARRTSISSGPKAVEERRPFLVVGTLEKRLIRRQRSHTDLMRRFCVTEECCRLIPLYVDFKRIGWNFIKAPDGYHVNYCHGRCNVLPWDLVYPYSHVHDGVKNHEVLSNVTYITPCCSATRTSSMSLLFVNHDLILEKKDVPNMIVTSCGCA